MKTAPFIITTSLLIFNSFAENRFRSLGNPRKIEIKESDTQYKVKIALVLSSDTYICQLIKFNKPVDKFYTIKIHNVSSYNILSEKSRKHMETCLFDKEVKINILRFSNDTIIGDIEYKHPKTSRKALVSQTLVRNGWSCYLKDTEDINLELLEEKARETQSGIWEMFDPIRVKQIQDSIKNKLQQMIDSLEQNIPIDSLIIL